MRDRIFVIKLITPIMMCGFFILILGLESAGWESMANIFRLIACTIFAVSVIFSRCPYCGFPLLIDFRRYATDCIRCGMPLDSM